MAYWLCLSPFIVSLSLFIVLDLVSLWKTLCIVSVWHFYNCTFMNHTVPGKMKSFCKSQSYLFSISIHYLTWVTSLFSYPAS